MPQQQNRKYLGVVSGGYDDPIGTDSFKVTVPPTADLRHDRSIARWTIVSVDTKVWDAEQQGVKFEMRTLGIVEDVEILPGHAFEDDREMARSDYYANEQFRQQGFLTTQEDAVRLRVRAIGHVTEDNKDLYGPVRPPERESAVYVAESEEVRLALMKPMNRQQGSFCIGGYATLYGLYRPFTEIILPSHQVFLHGAIFAASGWGKTMVMKYLLREFHRLSPSPAIVIFNIKGGEFYDLEKSIPESELNKIFQRSPDVKELWNNLGLQPQGFDHQRITYYPLGADIRKIGNLYSFRFSDIKPDEEGQVFLRSIVEPFALPEPSKERLNEYLLFCKRHLTDRAQQEVQHPKAKAILQDQQHQQVSFNDTLNGFISLLRRAQSLSRGDRVNITCSQCNDYVRIPSVNVDAIIRVLGELQRLHIFDVGQPINIQDLMRPGHISVLDVAGLQSVLAQQIFIQHILHSIFNKANQIFLGIQSIENYSGVVILLDEAWRFFQQPEVLDELERISRMGRSLKVGLWLADQSIPTGQREWHVLNNMHTRLLGSITADKSLIGRVMPLSDSMVSALPNLRRGMAIFFNQEYSRVPTPVMIPPCTCYHEGD